MKHLLILSAALAAFFALAPQCRAEVDAQKALTQIGEFMVGNWTPADQEDKNGPRKHVYSWILNNKFVRSNGQQDPQPWDGYMGIDLKNNKLGWWGFFADGSSGVIYLTKFSEKEWVFEGDDYGPNGKFRRKVTIEIPVDGKLHGKIEDTLNGETTVVEQDWVRHR